MKKILLLILLGLSTSAFAQDKKKNWDWTTDGTKNTRPERKYVDYSPPPPAYKWKFVEQEKIATQFVYNRYPVIRPDGTFPYSTYAAVNPRIYDNYGVSGAAFNRYIYDSTKRRQEVENKIEADRAAVKFHRNYYLHNNTPWLRSKVK